MKETLAEQKDRLLATREDYKQALLNEVIDAKNDLLATKDKVLMEAKNFKDDLLKTKDWVLLIGGVVLLGYVALRGIAAIVGAFSPKDEKENTLKEVIIEKPYQVYNPQEEEKETFFSPIIRDIKKEMTMFLLGLAKQALLEFLGRMQQKDTKN
jgi:hypothetical protein